jgi:hypothetical protein
MLEQAQELSRVLEKFLGEEPSRKSLKSSVPICWRATPQRASGSLRFPNLKIGANFRGTQPYHHAARHAR